MAYDFNSLTKQAPEATNRDGFYTDFEDVDPSKLHQITELTEWMRTKAKGSDVREVIAQLFERTWVEGIKEGNANLEVAQARGTHPNLRSRLDESDKKQRQNTAQLAEKANKDEVTNVMTPKGTLAYASLPKSGNQVGWYYYCPDGDGTHGAGNYVWNGTSWYFGGTGDEGYNLLKEDIVYLENSKRKYIISLSKNKEPNIEWSPSKPLAHNFTSNSDGFLKMISVATKNSGKIKIYVLSNVDGKQIDNNVGYIVRSENIFDVVSGENSISCDIRIHKGDTIAYHPIDGASVLYKDDSQGFKTYQLNNGVYLRSGSHTRFYSIDFTIESNMEYQKCIDDVYKYSVSSNLIGMDFDTFYPVDFKEQNYITVSTKDGSIFPQSSETYIGMYDKNKNFIRNFRLNNTLSYRHIALRESDKDCAYIKWNSDAPAVECMVNYGIDILPYTVYFKNTKQNELDIKKLDIKKVDTTDVNYIGNSKLVSKCMEFTNLFYGDYIVSGKTAPSKTESFLFFTDPHTVEGSGWENGCRNMLQTIKNYYDSTPTSFVVCGGDWIGNSDTPDKACYKLGLIKGFMDKLFSNNYLIVGNHDTNYQGKANESAETRTTRLSNDAISGLMFNGKKAYYSFKGNYTTFYCFDTGVENQKLEDCDNYFWEQAIWFCESLIKNESEHIVIFMHILFYNNVINQMANQVDDIANKFNNRGIKYINNIPYDFSNVKGKIDFILCGHNHADSNGLTERGIAYANTKNAYPNDTATFDMVMIDYDNRIVNLVRVGEGNSRKISMDTGELIN